MERYLKGLISFLTRQPSYNFTFEFACQKCGRPGHFTNHCHSFFKNNLDKYFVSDISSTSSESEEEFVSPLSCLRKQDLNTPSSSSKHQEKKNRGHSRSLHKPDSGHESDADTDTSSSTRRRRQKHKHLYKKKSKSHNSTSPSEMSS